MPTDWVSYVNLTESAQHLVAVAGRALQQTTYEFAVPGGTKFQLAVDSLEHSFARQHAPQRTIVALFGQSKAAANDEKMSSVGQLWRDGWRFERFAAQHCIKFSREAAPGAGPSGEIAHLRSYADFACVLGEWHELARAGDQILQARCDTAKPAKRSRKSAPASPTRPAEPTRQSPPLEVLTTPPPATQARKVSRFFADTPATTSGDARPSLRVSALTSLAPRLKVAVTSGNNAPCSSSRRWSSSAAAGWLAPKEPKAPPCEHLSPAAVDFEGAGHVKETRTQAGGVWI